MKKNDYQNKLIVYSCSGCSNVAQLANSIAIKLHRAKIAQMSCIAGVGGNVEQLVATAKNAEHILALDGCPLECVKKCLQAHDIVPGEHIVLTRWGMAKTCSEGVTEQEFDQSYQKVLGVIAKIESKF